MAHDPSPILESERDKRQRNLEWRLQRIAWAMFAVILAAVMLGLIGRGGPLSKRAVATPDGSFLMQYNRFVRKHSPDELRVTVHAQADTAAITIDSGYAESMKIDKVMPEPRRVIGGNGSITYVFDTVPGSQMRATFHIEPEELGSLQGSVSSGAAARLQFTQFVYP